MTEASKRQVHEFKTATKQLLHLVTHALYSNKEIFLRELVSNAVDAKNKLEFAALHQDSLYEDDHVVKIHIEIDKKKRLIVVRDNGIGMNSQEVEENLGTIAQSGTRQFLEKISGDKSKDSKLIGQFGVGFYSAFIIADKVTVNTRKAGLLADEGVRWISDGGGQYTIEPIAKASRGTEIILHLKEGEDEFLDDWRIRSIITKYSDYVDMPICLKKEKPKEEKEEKKLKKGEDVKDNALDKKNEEDKGATVTDSELIEAAKWEWEQVNRGRAIWTLSKSELVEKDFNELYKHICHDYEDPLLYSLNRIEGKLEYTSLLYIPAHAPFDLWQREHTHGLQLYVQQVFIMDKAEQFLPLYLRFVKGVIDSKDLSLNISREILQDSKIVTGIKAGVTKRILSMLEGIAKNKPEQYQKFWHSMGRVLKEGPGEDFKNKERIAKLLRFASTYHDNDKQNVSLDDYIKRMKSGQEVIYYLVADSFTAASNSPHLEVFKRKEIEVILLFDTVDEWLTAHLTEFSGKKLQSVAKGDLDLGDLEDSEEKKAKEQTKHTFESMIKQIKQVLDHKVSDVRITYRLTDSPACLVVGENDMSAHLQRIMEAAGQASPASKPVFELNPEHSMIKRLKDEADEDRFKEWIYIIFDQAVLAEGGKLDDPASFVKRLNKMLLELA